MQSNESTKKWSDLQGLAVIDVNTGKKVGTVDDFYFDTQTNSVQALLVKTGLFGHRILPSNKINAVGSDAITFPGEEVLIEEKDNPALAALPLGRNLLNYRILSEGGTLVGTIGNVLLSTDPPSMLHVSAFELSGGIRNRVSGRYATFEAKQITRYGQDVIIIPDAIAQSLA